MRARDRREIAGFLRESARRIVARAFGHFPANARADDDFRMRLTDLSRIG